MNIGIAPPSVLGECIIVVPLASTVNITRATLMNSLPMYTQVTGYPIGSIKIVGYDTSSPTKLLAQTNQTNTVGVMYTTGTSTGRMYVSGQNIINGTISMQNLTDNKFNVYGRAIGTSFLTYTATAALPDFSQEGEYATNVTGTIRIEVVPTANQKPSYVADYVTNVALGSSIILDSSFFLQNYTDPENDPASKVRFDIIPPFGMTLLNGNQVTPGTIVPVQLLSTGVLVYVTDINTQQVGDSAILYFSVSDVGSQQFYP